MTMAASASIPLPAGGDVEAFIDSVDDVARLVACLKEGTITPEYVDNKLEQRAKDEQRKIERTASARPDVKPVSYGTSADEARQEELRRKVEAIRESLERKRKARERYQAYVDSSGGNSSSQTDYNKWDMWCPSDDEDDMIKSLTPNSPEFRSMEKDIDERHERMVQQRQIAERERIKGNALFKEKRYTEAYQCYEIGLSHEKPNMALHANAAMTSIKMQCFVQAVTHCDKVLSIAEFFHNNKKDALCAKALHRRAMAYKALQQPTKVVADLKAALAIEPSNSEIAKDLAAAERDLVEHIKRRRVLKAKCQASQDTADAGMQELLQKLQEVEHHLASIKHAAAQLAPQAPAGALPRIAGPALPQRGPSQHWHAIQRACNKLQDLLESDESACIYFHEMKGINAATTLVCTAARSLSSVGYCDKLLRLLNAACLSEGNMLAISQDDRFLKACVSLLALPVPSERIAAVTLMHTLSTAEEPRKRLSCSLSSDTSSSSITAYPAEACDIKTGVMCLLDSLSSSDATIQAPLLSLLGNCAVDKAVQVQFRQVMERSSNWSPLARCAASKDTYVAQRALALLGNLCSDPALRHMMSSADAAIVGTLVPLAIPGASSDTCGDTQTAALGTLYNLALDPSTQGQFTAGDVTGLLGVLSCSGGSSGLQQRAAALLSRVVQNRHLLEALQTEEHTMLLLDLLAAQLLHTGRAAQDAAPPQLGSGGRGVSWQQHSGATIEHLARIVTRCLTQATISCLAAAAAAGGMATLLGLTTEALDSSETIQGNAALAVSSFASHQQFWDQLRKLSAVPKLIRIAHRGKGNTASKNAAIALARMAHDPAMLVSIREQHGIEIICQYVKP